MNKNKIIIGITVVLVVVAVFVWKKTPSEPVTTIPSVTPVVVTPVKNTPPVVEVKTTPAGTYTMEQVAQHASTASCWTVVNGSVYDLTKWILRHPGGTRAITGMCGRDATADFLGQHGGQGRPESELAGYKIGKISKT